MSLIKKMIMLPDKTIKAINYWRFKWERLNQKAMSFSGAIKHLVSIGMKEPLYDHFYTETSDLIMNEDWETEEKSPLINYFYKNNGGDVVKMIKQAQKLVDQLFPGKYPKAVYFTADTIAVADISSEDNEILVEEIKKIKQRGKYEKK